MNLREKMVIFRTIIFPFYRPKTKHEILRQKWWFRLLSILYLLAIIPLWLYISSEFSFSAWGWCYDSLDFSSNTFSSDIEYCRQLADDNKLHVILGGVAVTAFLHYLIQFIFFKIVIGYIMGENLNLPKSEKNMEKTNKLTLPVAIVKGVIAFSIAFYAVQKNKSDSIAEQNRVERLAETEQQELQSKRAECETLSDGVREKWNNVMGVTYNEFWKECFVTYTDPETGKVESSALHIMETTK